MTHGQMSSMIIENWAQLAVGAVTVGAVTVDAWPAEDATAGVASVTLEIATLARPTAANARNCLDLSMGSILLVRRRGGLCDHQV